MRILLIFLAAVAATLFHALAQSPWQENSFYSYINGDGSSMEQAVVIKAPQDLNPCSSYDCRQEEFPKIIREEMGYLEAKLGRRGKSWEVQGQTDMEVDIEQCEKFYDKVAVNVFSTGRQEVFYFDITEPILAMNGD